VDVQADAAIHLAEINWERIKHKAVDKIDKVINGVRVTQAGLMAAAHLTGPGAVKKWLETDGKESASDANGTKIEDYLKLYLR
jgi:hypothetical protein